MPATFREFSQARIFCYTGTGNTLRVCRWLSEELRGAGVPSRIELMEIQARPENLGGSELLVLAFPTHGYTAPWSAIRFALRLPRGNGNALCVVTHKGNHGSTLAVMGAILRAKGYTIHGMLDVFMPQNWFQFNPIGNPAADEKIKEAARLSLSGLLEASLTKKAQRTAFQRFLRIFSQTGLFCISLLYLFWGRFVLAKAMFTNNKCNGCGLCSRHCPTGAIRMLRLFGRRPYLRFRCEGCARCAAVCPRNAIEFGHSWLAVLVVVSSRPADLVLAWLLPFLSPSLPRFPFNVAATLFGLWSCYLGFHLLTRIPFFNALATLSTGTHYWGRYRESDSLTRELLELRDSFS